MGRIIGGAILGAIVIYALFVFFEARQQELALAPPQPALPLGAGSTAFDEVGTLVFYPNNVGPVPYLFYTDARGTLLSKALDVSDLPPTDFSSWSGGRVEVIGRLVAEHVVVTQLVYLAPPG